MLLDPGDEVWVEDPGYPGARLIFAAAGAKIVDIPVDEGGMDVHAARDLAPNARLAYVSAGRQAPLGSVLALDRRLSLDAHLKGLLEIPSITMGLDTPAFLPPGSNDQLIAQLAAQTGIESRPLSVYAGAHPSPPGLLLGFAAVRPEEIVSGAQTLARVLQ